MKIITAEVNHSVVGVMSLTQKATQLLEQVLATKTKTTKKHIDDEQCQDLRLRLTLLTKDEAEDQQQEKPQDKAEDQQQEKPKDKAEDQQQQKPKDKPRPSTRASEAA